MLVRATNDELHFCGFGEIVTQILWPLSNMDFNYRQLPVPWDEVFPLLGLHNSHNLQGQ